MKTNSILFPHENARPSQHRFISDVEEALSKRKNLLAHAPTGVGKTAAVLAPALSYAIKHDLKIFFLTSRHTQHYIVIDTLKKIKEKYNTAFFIADIIGKKFMCLQSGIENLRNSEFHDYCKSLREQEKCNYFANMRLGNKLSVLARKTLQDLEEMGPSHIENTLNVCGKNNVCPYEIAANLARKAKIIISDYYYVFNENIRNQFFSKIGVDLEKCILIIDEGHNLPRRITELLSERLSSLTIKKAIKEAKKFKYYETLEQIVAIQDFLNKLAKEKLKSADEALVEKEELTNEIKNYDLLISNFEFVADLIREQQKKSAIGSIAKFLSAWKGKDDGFLRMISAKNDTLILSYRCIDPGHYAGSIINKTHSTIVMSGTLQPLEFYADLLDFKKYDAASYENPFPQENRLNIIIPKTTTKYNRRNNNEFHAIAKICSEIINTIPGNAIIYFPSYELRNKISDHIKTKSKKTLFFEEQGMQKKEKKELLDRFSSYKDAGAVLLSVIGGSFSEGIDLPGILKCVVVVGIPFQQPDLETKQTIEYFSKKFGEKKGKEYGYILPAINKVIQAAGRCIRSEKDKGVIILLDERYSYYQKYLEGLDYIISYNYSKEIEKFFGKSSVH